MTIGMSVYQRGKRWYVRMRTPEGRDVRTSLGPQVRTKAQAEAVWREMEKRRLEGKLGLLDASRTNLGQFRAEYLAHRRPLGISPGTIRRDDQALRSLADVVGDSCLLRSLTPRKIQEWAGVLLSRGIKPATVNSYLRHIKAALNTAVEWNQLEQAPRLKPVKEPQRLPRHLLPEQVERLLQAEGDPLRRRLWTFFIWTGARREEVVRLQWQDVHLVGKPYAVLTGKGNKQRVCPLTPQAVKALGQAKDLGPVWVFPDARGRKPFQPHKDTMSHWFKEAARAAGVAWARLHDLRHTAITYMLSRGVGPRMVQEIVGHASITTTEGYSKALVADLYDEIMKGLE